MNNNTISEIALGKIHPSPTNPRKHFDQAKLAELAASIKEKGLMSPLVVRTKPVSSGAYEIIAGERRWRAAKLAGLKAVPVIVRKLDDRQVLELQMIENLQRDDLTALEEAHGYEQMLALTVSGKPVYTVATLATAIGKSERHVIHRRQLARLKGEALDALEASLLAPSTALVLCRIQNDSVLKQVVDEVLHHRNYHGQIEPMGRNSTEQLINQKYARSLKGAAFNAKDAELVPEVGACLGCSKCSGSNTEFFGTVAEMCYDINCFQRKLDAVWQRQTDEARATNTKVLSEQETKNLFYNNGNVMDGNYLDLDAKPSEYQMAKGIKPAKWDKLLKNVEVPTMLARDLHGQPRRLVEKKAALAALNNVGQVLLQEQTATKSSSCTDSYEKQHREELALNSLSGQMAVNLLLEKMLDDKGRFVAPPELWKIVYGHTLNSYAQTDGCALMGKAFGLERKQPTPSAWENALANEAKSKSNDELLALTVIALVARWIKYHGVKDDMLKKLAGLYKISLADVLKNAQKTLKEKKKKS